MYIAFGVTYNSGRSTLFLRTTFIAIVSLSSTKKSARTFSPKKLWVSISSIEENKGIEG